MYQSETKNVPSDHGMGLFCGGHGLYSKTCLKRSFKIPNNDFQDLLSLKAGQTYCRMLKGEHSALLSTFIKLSFVIKIFVLSIFEWPLKTGLTVLEQI